MSDGEFVTLRTRGEKRSVHIWQLIHDARSSVSKLGKQKILEMLLLQGGTLLQILVLHILLMLYIINYKFNIDTMVI